MAEIQEPRTDDMSIGLQMQQFLDEWSYRVVHANMSMVWDQVEANCKAMDLLEIHGVQLLPGEKENLAEMQDEEDMISALVKRMPEQARNTFEHFALQLQLVLSTVTRVRHALETLPDNEVASVMDDSESHINQTILKNAIVQASRDIGRKKEVHDDWEQNMEHQIARLKLCSDESIHVQQQLDALQSQLGSFGGNQKDKNKAVLNSMASKRDNVLLHSVYTAWVGMYMKFLSEKSIHEKFRKEISDAEEALLNFKMKHLEKVRSVMNRRHAGNTNQFLKEVLQTWKTIIETEKEERELGGALKAAQEKLAQFNEEAKAASRKVMQKMSAGSDNALLGFCLQGWIGLMSESTQTKAFKEQQAAVEAQLAEFTKRKGAEAKGVLGRMSGSTDTGLLTEVWKAWSGEYKENKRERMEAELLEQKTLQFNSINARQKGSAYGTAERTNEVLQENLVFHLFLSWSTAARHERVIRHYSGKLEAKKHQLESVQTMFKTFASQLEQGLGASPRSRKTDGSKSRPPQAPA